MRLPLSLIRTNGGTQPRAMLYGDVAREYADDMEAGASLPPAVAFFDGSEYWLADGFHREAAHRSLGLSEMDVDVRQGTKNDAIWFSCSANQGHGIRRTIADKRRAVETALRLKPELSDRAIAEHVGVGNHLVAEVRKVQVGESPNCTAPTRTGRDGKTYPAKPKAPRAPSAKQEQPPREPSPPVATSQPATTHDTEPAGGEPEREEPSPAPAPPPSPVEAPGVRLMHRRTEFAVRVRAVLDDFGDLSTAEKAELLRNEADLIAKRSAA